MARESAREIDLAAARWAARVDRGLTAAEEAALDAWVSLDTRRLGAFAKARAVSLHSERAVALGPNYRPSGFRVKAGPDLVGRRGLIFGGGGLIAAGVAAAFGVRLMNNEVYYATRKGEVRVIPLADGSVVTLNTSSRIAVRYSRERRDVKLLRGEALFDVAKDRDRPFVVAADHTIARAVGTSFTVRRLPTSAVQVLVREGVVEVTQHGSASYVSVMLPANTRALTSRNYGPIQKVSLPGSEVRQRLAWREGRIAFEGEKLSDAVSEFARYSDTKIELLSPGLGDEEIVGLFQANDPVKFAQTVGSAFNLQVEVSDLKVTLSRQ